jgi:tetratricopeptide (TPR) repeat protein
VGKQDRKAIETIAQTALAITERENWLDMTVVILLTRAAGYLSLQVFDLALADYRLAYDMATQGEEKQIPGCNKLRLQAKISEGTCLFTAGHFEEAAQAYDQAAQIAEQQKDLLMSLEGWRMASFCMERKKDNQQAWEHGKKALAVGRLMDAQQRPNSTLPFLGQALLRISPSSQVTRQVKITFEDLLGEGWLENVEGMAKAC